MQVSGDMTIHGKTNQIAADGFLEVTMTGITARMEFKLNPEDYGIKIPKVVRNKIAESLKITVELKCDPI